MSENEILPIDPFSPHQLHTLLGAAHLLNVSRSSIERWKTSGELGPWIQLGRRWYIRGSDLKAFIDRKARDGDEMPMAAE